MGALLQPTSQDTHILARGLGGRVLPDRGCQMLGQGSYVVLIGGGVLLLVLLATVVGLVDGRAKDRAWKRIAIARRLLHEREQELFKILSESPCEDCPLSRKFRRYRGE